MSKIKFEPKSKKKKKNSQPSHHSSPELRVLEKLSMKGHEIKAQ